jgi:hypothetical protein
MKFYFLLVIYGDVSSEVEGPFVDDDYRVDRAREIKRARGDKDGLFRLNISENGAPEISDFGGAELE